MRFDGGGPGQFEHYVVTTFIPESVRTKWNEWRQSLKSEEKSHLGNNNISDSVEMAGWGVEQAQERNREEASEFEPNFPLHPPLVPFPIWLSHYVEMSQTAPRHEREEKQPGFPNMAFTDSYRGRMVL
jgi:hypothetical protein